MVSPEAMEGIFVANRAYLKEYLEAGCSAEDEP